MKHLPVFVDFETTGCDFFTDYPIEVGLIFCNEKLSTLDTLNTMIYFEEDERRPLDLRKGERLEAAKVHKISQEEYERYAKTPKAVCQEIERRVVALECEHPPVLVSDNPVFDYYFMQKLFHIAKRKFPFYYHALGLDSMWALCPVQRGKSPHRAFEDAQITLQCFKETFPHTVWAAK